ncbi:MAG TPA: ferredoxin [Polyangiaceae bacterium]
MARVSGEAGVALRIVVDRDLCESNAVCVRTAPDMFVIDDDDRMHLLVERPAPEQIENARAAVRRCPRRALSLAEE